MTNPGKAVAVNKATVTALGAAAAEDVALIKQQYLPDGTDNQLRLLLAFGKNKGLNLVTRQYYGVIRKTKRGDTYVPVMTIQVGIDGYRALAQRGGEYDSQDGPYWCGPDGVWLDVWLDDAPPVAAKIGIRRKGSDHTTYHIAKYREYCQYVERWDGAQGSRKLLGREPNEMWKTMPSNQLAKCAEAGALRKACPQAMAMLGEVDPEVEVEFSEGAPASIHVEEPEPAVRRPRPPIERPRARVAPPQAAPVVVDTDGVIEGEYAEAADAAHAELDDMDAGFEQAEGPLPSGPRDSRLFEDQPVNWTVFYGLAKGYGFSSAQAKEFAKAESFASWRPVELNELLDKMQAEHEKLG